MRSSSFLSYNYFGNAFVNVLKIVIVGDRHLLKAYIDVKLNRKMTKKKNI